MRLWICEKRDQAKNIAPLLGNPKPGPGYIDTDNGRVVWGRGHLGEMVGQIKGWRLLLNRATGKPVRRPPKR